MGEDFVGVAGDFYPGPDFFDFAVFVDEKCRAVDAHVFAAIHAFLYPHAIAFADVALFIGGEGEFQIVFGLELFVLFHAAFRDADDGDAELFE